MTRWLAAKRIGAEGWKCAVWGGPPPLRRRVKGCCVWCFERVWIAMAVLVGRAGLGQTVTRWLPEAWKESDFTMWEGGRAIETSTLWFDKAGDGRLHAVLAFGFEAVVEESAA